MEKKLIEEIEKVAPKTLVPIRLYDTLRDVLTAPSGVLLE